MSTLEAQLNRLMEARSKLSSGGVVLAKKIINLSNRLQDIRDRQVTHQNRLDNLLVRWGDLCRQRLSVMKRGGTYEEIISILESELEVLDDIIETSRELQKDSDALERSLRTVMAVGGECIQLVEVAFDEFSDDDESAPKDGKEAEEAKKDE